MLLQWFPEVSHFNPRTPVLLVGTKLDLRNNAKTIEQLRQQNIEIVPIAQVVSCLCWKEKLEFTVCELGGTIGERDWGVQVFGKFCFGPNKTARSV